MADPLHGNFEMDAHILSPRFIDRGSNVPEKMLMNGFANFIYENNNFSAGLRYESYLDPILGYDPTI